MLNNRFFSTILFSFALICFSSAATAGPIDGYTCTYNYCQTAGETAAIMSFKSDQCEAGKSGYDVYIPWGISWSAIPEGTKIEIVNTLDGKSITLKDENLTPDPKPGEHNGNVYAPCLKTGSYAFQLKFVDKSGETTAEPTEPPAVQIPTSPSNNILINGSSDMTQLIVPDAGQLTPAPQLSIKGHTDEIDWKLTKLYFSHPNVINAEKSYVNDQGQLILVGAKPGRTSMKILLQDKSHFIDSQIIIGVTVKTATGQMPSFPSDHLAIGSVSQDDAGVTAFWRSFTDPNQAITCALSPDKPTQECANLLNKRVDIRYIYLTGGIDMTPAAWASRAKSFVHNSNTYGMMPFFIVYGINNGEDSLDRIIQGLANKSFMEKYYESVKAAVQSATNNADGTPVGYLIEPDFLGYVIQKYDAQGGLTGKQIADEFEADVKKDTGKDIQVSAAYDAGVLDTSDPKFGNNLQGLVESINYIIRKYSSNAQIGWQLNLWATPGSTGRGIIHATEVNYPEKVPFSQTQASFDKGRKVIAEGVKELSDIVKYFGVTYANANFISIDKYGLDGALYTGDQDPGKEPENSTWFWNEQLWNNYLFFVKNLHENMSLPVILWQTPVGHINNFATEKPKNPYPSNERDSKFNTSPYFGELDNTNCYGEDSATTYFFGDTFKPDKGANGLRFNYFSYKPLDPNQNGETLRANAETGSITWPSHIQRAKDSGVIVLLMGAGVGISTQGVPAPVTCASTRPSDDYYWIARVQEFLNSVKKY